MSRTLLPCPFCHSKNVILLPDKLEDPLTDFIAICTDCKISTRKAMTESIARNLWNYRKAEGRQIIYQDDEEF